jgi:hypothetical protein
MAFLALDGLIQQTARGESHKIQRREWPGISSITAGLLEASLQLQQVPPSKSQLAINMRSYSFGKLWPVSKGLPLIFEELCRASSIVCYVLRYCLQTFSRRSHP